MAIRKNSGTKRFFAQRGSAEVISPKFLAKMNKATEIQPVANDITAEALSDTIVESKVETDRLDERVRTTIKKDAGTLTLTEKVRTEHGIATRTETFATAGSTTPSSSALVVKADTDNKGNGWEETDSVAVASFPLLVGQTYDRALNAPIKFTEQRQAIATAAAGLGVAGVDITPEDFSRSVVRTYDLTSVQAVLDAIVESNFIYVDLDLPPVLTGFTARYSKDYANGTSTKTATSASGGVDEFSLSLSANASAQGGAGIIADIVPDIAQADGQNRKALEYFFFMASVYTFAQLITRLNAITAGSVAAWPRFNKVPVTIVAYGEKRSETTEAEYSEALKITSTGTVYKSFAQGQGHSGDVSLNTKLIQIPPTLHAALSLPSGDNQTFSVQAATAGTVSLSETGSGLQVVAGGFVSSTANLAATSPTAVPTTGLYLHRVDTQSYGFGRKLVRAIVVDFANL